MQKILLYNSEKGCGIICELEISIHNKCNLCCNECGFFIPKQPQPFIFDPIKELDLGLNILKKNNIYISTLVIVGGEPLINKELLESALIKVQNVGNVEKIEVVSNGLYPQGLSKISVQYIDRFVISKYFDSDILINLWEHYLQTLSPKIEFVVRKNQNNWDKWWGDYVISQEKAQEMYENCFYRKHCVTFERNRLFVCSRIAKQRCDSEGLLLDQKISFQDIEQYLNSPKALSSCMKCVPMMDFQPIKGGIQPDNRISKLERNAINFLQKKNSMKNKVFK